MNAINFDTNSEKMLKYLHEICDSKSQCVVWQRDGESNSRLIYKATINEVIEQNEELAVYSLKNEDFHFIQGEIFFYCVDTKIIFKAQQVSMQSNFLTVKFPNELKILDDAGDEKIKNVFFSINAKFAKEHFAIVSGDSTDDYVQTQVKGDREILEDQIYRIKSFTEEDELFGSMREAPRARASVGKIVTLGDVDDVVEGKKFDLFDLSRGGFSFLTRTKKQFDLKSLINVLAFDQNKFTKPMIAQVMNVVEIDDEELRYKYGCRFLSDDEMN